MLVHLVKSIWMDPSLFYFVNLSNQSIFLFHTPDYMHPSRWIYEPRHEKIDLRGFQPGPTQTRLYSHRRWLEACNFGFRKKRDCIYVAKNKGADQLFAPLFSHMQKPVFS